tara:strand:+ start:915 stop:1349 length:435 start_codon:yes stop_codon:yes gene_type:complete
MTSSFLGLIQRLIKAAVAICIGLSLILLPLATSVQASEPVMSGNYVEDTVSVAESLKQTIAIPREAEERIDSETQAIQLITAYISRYRNRSQVNKSLSYTTMQTALNAMAGHYKTFSNRPLPDQLKERLNSQLDKAEALATKES